MVADGLCYFSFSGGNLLSFGRETDTWSTLWRPLLPSFVIFDIRTLWRSAVSVRVPGCQKYKWHLNPVSCTIWQQWVSKRSGWWAASSYTAAVAGVVAVHKKFPLTFRGLSSCRLNSKLGHVSTTSRPFHRTSHLWVLLPWSRVELADSLSIGWLKMKYHARQYAIYLQPVVWFWTIFWSCLILTRFKN